MYCVYSAAKTQRCQLKSVALEALCCTSLPLTNLTLPLRNIRYLYVFIL